jgi:hypothetical protein
VNGIYDKKQELFRFSSAVPDTQREVVYLINRIDSATSGILLMTTDSNVSKIVKKLFVERKISKIYKAIVFSDSKTLMKQKSLHWESVMEVHIHVYIFICIFILCICINIIYVCIYICVRIYLHLYVGICVCIFMHIYIYIYIL